MLPCSIVQRGRKIVLAEQTRPEVLLNPMNHRIILLRIAAILLILGGGVWLWEIWIWVPRNVTILNSELSGTYADGRPGERIFVSAKELGFSPVMAIVQIITGILLILFNERRVTRFK